MEAVCDFALRAGRWPVTVGNRPEDCWTPDELDPLMAGRGTHCRVPEDVRRSKAMSKSSASAGGSTFKIHSESAPFSPPVLPPAWSKHPCLLPGLPGYPCFCPACSQPILSVGSTGILLRYKVDLVPLSSSVQNPPVALLHQKSFISDNSLLSQLYLVCDTPNLPPPTHTPLTIIQVGRKWNAVLNRVARNDI